MPLITGIGRVDYTSGSNGESKIMCLVAVLVPVLSKFKCFFSAFNMVCIPRFKSIGAMGIKKM